LFLFEDEQGVWQNRVDNLWIAVYGRAKLTDSVATALLNKITNGSLRAMAALEAAMTKPPPSQSDTNGTLGRSFEGGGAHNSAGPK